MVAEGFKQRSGIDFFETFASVARLSSLRLLIPLVAKYDLQISQLDIETASLNGKIDTEVFMEPLKRLSEMLGRMVATETDLTLRSKVQSILLTMNTKKPIVCKFLKALCGFRQAGCQ